MSRENISLKPDYFAYLAKIINSDAISSDQFIDFVLRETVLFAQCKTVYLYEFDKDERRMKLRSSSGSGRSEIDLMKEHSVAQLLNIEIFKKGEIPNVPVIINEYGKDYPASKDSELKTIIHDRICIIPLSSDFPVQAVLVLTNKLSDFRQSETNVLQVVLNLFWKILGRYRFADEMVNLKTIAEENERQKNNFMISVSHEIKTPVNAIVGFSNLLAEADLPAETRKKFLNIILESSDELLTLTKEFAEISGLEENLKKTRKQEVDLKALLNEIVDSFTPKSDIKNIRLLLKLFLREDEFVIISDKEKLNQILTCLLNNAFKFTYNGEISVECIRKNGVIEFRIADSGIGIPEEDKESIFRYFQPGGDIISKMSGGTGIGLAISYALVKHLGGDIWFTSVVGEGSVFCFTLPFDQTPVRNETMANASARSISDNISIKTILVAEDDENNYSLIENILKKQSFNVLRASNGQEAVDICRKKKIDLVLMDIKMPVMDGYTATGHILASNPDQKIIAQTAYPGEKNYAVSKGCVDFITKPFSKQDLLQMLSNYLYIK